MVVVRLKRMGRKKRPFFRVVAVDSRVKRDGKVLEYLGYYDPLVQKESTRKEIIIDKNRYNYWVEKGAKPSLSVLSLVKRCISD